MDFDSQFLEVKAVLEQFEVKTGTKLNAFAHPNTEDSKNQANSLINSLKKIRLLSKNDKNDKRRLHLFLLLNTSLPISSVLEEDRNCCHLIGRCPQLNSLIYFIISHHLELFPFLGETILYAPSEFSESLLKEFISNVKHVSDHFDELSALNIILISIYKKLSCNISIQSSNCKCIKQFQEILLMYKKPSQLTAKMLATWSDLDRHKYYGFLVLSLISVLLECTKLSFERNSDEDCLVTAFDNMYNFSSFKVSETSIDSNENIISECYELILGVSKTFLLEKISSSMFLDWIEIDISETKTLQRVVGEKIYHCRKALLNVDQESSFVSKNLKNTLKDLTYCLSHLEVKPLSLAEELKDLNFKQLVSKFDETHQINSDEDTALILRTILQDQTFFEEVTEIIRIIKAAGALLKYDDIKFLILNCHLKSSSMAEGTMKELKKTVFKSIKNLSSEEEVSMLEEYLDLHGQSQPRREDLVNFEEKLIEVFNKFVSTNSSNHDSGFLSKVVFLCFYSIGDVAVKILLECLRNPNYIKDMVPILKILRPSLQRIQSSCNTENKFKAVQKISENEGEVWKMLENSHGDLLIDLLHILIFDEDTKQNPAKRSSLLDLVNYLIDEAVIEKNTFYLEVILNNIYLGPHTSNATINFLLQFLFKALVESPDESLDIEIPVVLIQLGQLLEKIRWEPKTFASWRSAMVSNLVFLISSIIKKSAAQIHKDTKKCDWFKSYIKTFSAQTQFLYSLEFLCPPADSTIFCFEKKPDTFILVLNAMHNEKFDFSALNKINEIEVAWTLFMVLSTSCDEEWTLFGVTLSRNKLFNEDSALSFFNRIVDALLIGVKLMEISLAEDNSRARSWINCYHNVLINFNSFSMNFLLKHLLMHPTQVKVQSFKKLSVLIQTVPVKIRSQSSILFLKLLISFIPHLVENIDNNAKAVLFTEIVYNSIHKLDLEARQLFAKKAESFLRKKVPAILL